MVSCVRSFYPGSSFAPFSSGIGVAAATRLVKSSTVAATSGASNAQRCLARGLDRERVTVEIPPYMRRLRTDTWSAASSGSQAGHAAARSEHRAWLSSLGSLCSVGRRRCRCAASDAQLPLPAAHRPSRGRTRLQVGADTAHLRAQRFNPYGGVAAPPMARRRRRRGWRASGRGAWAARMPGSVTVVLKY